MHVANLQSSHHHDRTIDASSTSYGLLFPQMHHHIELLEKQWSCSPLPLLPDLPSFLLLQMPVNRRSHSETAWYVDLLRPRYCVHRRKRSHRGCCSEVRKNPRIEGPDHCGGSTGMASRRTLLWRLDTGWVCRSSAIFVSRVWFVETVTSWWRRCLWTSETDDWTQYAKLPGLCDDRFLPLN